MALITETERNMFPELNFNISKFCFISYLYKHPFMVPGPALAIVRP